MTPQFHQIDHWLASQHRLVRWSPVDQVSSPERIDAVEFTARALWRFATATGVDLGHLPVATTSVERDAVKPSHVLAAISQLQANVAAAYLTYGLSAAHAGGIYELTNRDIPLGAGPARHEPDYDKVLKDVYKK